MMMTQRKPKPGDKPANTAAHGSSSPQVVEIRPSEQWQGVTYQLIYKVRRNAKGTSYSKNPYWYAYWHDARSNRTKSKYIGRQFRELTEDEF